MKIVKTKNHLVLHPETGNDCFTCGVISSMQPASLEMADYGLKSVSIPDYFVIKALCSGKTCLAKGATGDPE